MSDPTSLKPFEVEINDTLGELREESYFIWFYPNVPTAGGEVRIVFNPTSTLISLMDIVKREYEVSIFFFSSLSLSLSLSPSPLLPLPLPFSFLLPLLENKLT